MTDTRGFSLIEVLVSIVVLSFGLLGMVGMQAASLHANREARLQSSGVVLARELADMIRGDKVVGILTGTANPYLVSGSGSTLVAATPSYCLSVSATTACADNAEIANAEMTDWLARVNAELPGARVVSCYDSAPFNATTGLPTWNCTAPVAGATAPIVIKIGWTKSSTNKSNQGANALEYSTGNSAAAPSVVLQVTAGI